MLGIINFILGTLFVVILYFGGILIGNPIPIYLAELIIFVFVWSPIVIKGLFFSEALNENFEVPFPVFFTTIHLLNSFFLFPYFLTLYKLGC